MVKHQIPPFQKRLAAVFQQILRAGQCRQRGGLGNRTCARCALGLHRGHAFDQILRANAKSNPPSCHGIGFRHAIGDQHFIPHFGQDIPSRGEINAIGQVLINLIAHQPAVWEISQHRANLTEFFRPHHRPCGVAGGIDQQPAGFRRHGRPQVICIQLKAVFSMGRHNNNLGPAKPDDIGVTCPERGGHDDFITVVQTGQKAVKDCVFRP